MTHSSEAIAAFPDGGVMYSDDRYALSEQRTAFDRGRELERARLAAILSGYYKSGGRTHDDEWRFRRDVAALIGWSAEEGDDE